METKKAMKLMGFKYFSQLTPNQKNKTVNTIRLIKNDLSNLSYGLGLEILKNLPIEQTFNDLDYINCKINKQKMFYHKESSCFFPLNIKEIIKNP